MKKIRVKENLSFDTKSIVIMGVLAAIEIILSRFLSINAWNIKIGFSFIPIAIAAILLGPLKGGIVAAISDFIGAILFPIGVYFPGFTLTAFFTGFVFGVFLYRNQSTIRIILAVSINQLIFSLVVNTFWISVLYGSPYGPLFLTRITQAAVLIPVQLIILRVLSKAFVKRKAIFM